MKNTILRILIMGSLVALTACGGGGGGDTTTGDGTTGASLSLIAISGTNIDSSTTLNTSINTACYSNNGNGVQESMSIVDTTWTYITKTYSADTTCSNTPSVKTVTAALVIDQNVNINGWIDGQGQALPTPPSKASDPMTPLLTNELYTRINVTVTSSDDVNISVGFTTNFGFIIDDSFSSGVTLYRVDENGFAKNADPYTSVVSNGYMSVGSEVYVDNPTADTANKVSVTAIYDPGTTYSRSMITARYNFSSSPKQNGQFYDDVSITVNAADVFASNQTTYNESNSSLGVRASYYGISYAQIPHVDNTLMINSTGTVGQTTTGTYNFVICPLTSISGSTCTTASPSISGVFSIKRSPDYIAP